MLSWSQKIVPHGGISVSVTVNDILGLPCLKGAKVVAGKGGLSKVVSSVSVLEFADPGELQQNILSNIEFYGSEIVITAFASIPNNVEKQCANIRRLAAVGEVGMILYYVGLLMPKVDRALIDLANQLDFVLIVMPENQLNLRYSEVICEVMEAIFHDQNTNLNLVSDILAQISRLPDHQRTVDTVLRLVRDRIRCTLLLMDHNSRMLGMAAWPVSLELQLQELPQIPTMTGVMLSKDRSLWRCQLEPQNPQSMELYLVKDGAPLQKELVVQVVDVVRLAVNLWSSHHADVQISELVRAILRDEPLKMRRLAELFHIDVESMHAMWVLQGEEAQQGRFEQCALSALREVLGSRCKTVVADYYEGYAVSFMDWPDNGENPCLLADTLLRQLAERRLSVILTRCHHLQNTADVRKAFLLNRDHLKNARRIWPQKRSFTSSELEYAARCREIVNAGEDVLQKALRPLLPLDRSKESVELRKTLTAYLLDADGNVAKTGELLYLHKNTIKYRMGRISQMLEHEIGKEPERSYLYQAAAICRLMESK